MFNSNRNRNTEIQNLIIKKLILIVAEIIIQNYLKKLLKSELYTEIAFFIKTI